MATDDDAFLKRLLATFRLEADEHLEAMGRWLRQLGHAGDDPAAASAAVEALFREAHSLKGAARAVNLGDVERVCQAMERALSAVKRGERVLPAGAVDTLQAAVDGLSRLLAPDGGGAPAAGTLIRRLDAMLADAPGAAPAPPPVAPVAPVPPRPEPPAAADHVRIATARLESMMAQAEELQPMKASLEHLADELQALALEVADWRRRTDKTVRHARALRRSGVSESQALTLPQRRALALLLDGATSDELALRGVADRIARLARQAAQERRALGSRVDRLQGEMKQALTLPMSHLADGMGKLVRDIARDSGKEVELVVEGGALEVDRRILEQLRAPLIHLLRNAVDHGIEAPAERQRRGKPARGRIELAFAPHEGHQALVTLCDDGAGIALERVRARAARMGLSASGGDDADLVFASGLSTSPMLTDLSGHGLGLAIVREKVEGLGGSVRALPGPGGVGTCFRIVLPTTLATFRGLLVNAGGQSFVLPSNHVERVGRVPRGSVADGRVELQGRALPVAGLAEVLGLRPVHDERPFLQLVVLHAGEQRIAFGVDEVVGDQEVLVKPFAPPLRRVRHVSGATVLGAGQVVPLLDPGDLLKTARTLDRAPVGAASHPAASLLVADDSVTSRTMLKEILESAGYRVATAVDGMDALSRLQRDPFDLLVSDVEMPRLDGFGLTARVRTDPQLAELPVVLVTALDSRADKERGVEVGANAYIVKSGFDQRHLLDAIRTLL